MNRVPVVQATLYTIFAADFVESIVYLISHAVERPHSIISHLGCCLSDCPLNCCGSEWVGVVALTEEAN